MKTASRTLNLDTPLLAVVGKKSVNALAAKLDLHTVGDLVRHYPRRYVKRGALTDIAELQVGEYATVLARVVKTTVRKMRNRPDEYMQVELTDDHRGTLRCTFFHPERLQWVIVPGLRALFSGEVSTFNGTKQLTHPQFEAVEDSEGVRPFISIYPAAHGLTSAQVGRCVRQVLDVLDDPSDPLPAELRRTEGLADLGRALRRIHLPETEADFVGARSRLVWDEAMGVQLALALRRQRAVQRPAAPSSHVPGGLLEAFDARLPFTLTAGQRRIGEELAVDLASTAPMNRLVQGDVGAGKTVVALRAMLQVVDNGRQAALLAPTEVLAAQHARSLRSLLGPLAQAGELGGAEQATRVSLLSGSLSAAAKKKALLEARSGEAGIVVGTHALIQDRVGFAELGLVVVDEQHRFGVEQRDALRGRGEQAPHLLVMTATPIPRTVAMTVYGDLEVSALRELPGGRLPIATTVVPTAEKPTWLQRVWARVHEEVRAGHQVYIVCPRVGGCDKTAADDVAQPDDGEGDERRPPLAVLDVAPALAEGPLKGVRLGVLHGRLPPEEKDAVMRAFDAGELDVVVATTVIEVGVDVPNATGMVILDADRFGLSQLHQLRGRVGRGSAPGVCLLVSDMPPGTPARVRLDAVAATTDGFELARLDLELRREGDVLGALQAGRRSGLRLLSLLHHEEVIARSRGYAAELVADDPGLAHHAGLRGLVAEIVGDEERAAYLDKV